MRETVKRLWPEIDWIQDPQLREQVTQTWMKALERSPLKPDDLRPWAGAGKNEPAGPGTDEATADPAKAARARSADAKPAPQKSFYDSLEQEMASLLNRPPPKP